MKEDTHLKILEAMSAAVKGNPRRARVILKRILTEEPENLEALIAIGALLNSSKETAEEAMNFLIRAVKIAPSNPVPWGHLGESLLLLAKYERAEKYLKKAIELKPDDAYYWHRLGMVYDKDKRRDEALEALHNSIELNPNDETTWISLGLVYLRRKDAENAIYAFEKVLELNPSNPIAQDNLDEVSKMKENTS
ncbi:MAG: tetratricopeptide repeat protein [Candidatus Thorarchaeota archaeon]|nr:tetratricopeptide repeat protein [Candidatus Thorarchaeota archaeon]